ncbi:type I restriction endonuclease subunit R, EcoR124 family, partial [Weissella paramesenteroides]|uniref:type I restriction endonuclease subunit R, EcoR124 family n=1 Tax=Weissella paramesenteroides TaxID=1249 RepID=UPI003982F0BB
VNYRNLKKATDDAITLFSAGDESSFYVKQYDELLSELNEHVLQLHKIVERPQDVDELYNQGEDVLSTFVVAFRDVMRTFNQIRVYDDFEWSDVDSFTDQDLESFQGKYQEVYHRLNDGPKKDKTSILEDIDFQIDLLSTDRIDVQYIVNLVKAINLDNKDGRQADVNKIKRLLDKAATDELKSKADLIAAFLDEMVPTLQSGDNIGDSLNAYLAKRREVAVSEF